MREYSKEREPILKKYTTSAALFYRRKLCFDAKKIPFEDFPPPKNAQEVADRAARTINKSAVIVGSFFNETD